MSIIVSAVRQQCQYWRPALDIALRPILVDMHVAKRHVIHWRNEMLLIDFYDSNRNNMNFIGMRDILINKNISSIDTSRNRSEYAHDA